MSNELYFLSITALSIGFLHTLFGPDHYLPFVMMAQSQKWTKLKTVFITILCGIGHVLSSVIIGSVGIMFGVAISKIEMIESFRGNVSAYLLTAFGIIYFIWGMKRAYRDKPHKHIHSHSDGIVHLHEHRHNKEHIHVHEEHNHSHSEEKTMNLTPWILFTIFIFGPCEALIPILMYPSVQNSIFDLVIVVAIFGVTTILTMITAVFILYSGLTILNFNKAEKYTHALSGATVTICGLAVIFLGV